MVKRNIAISSPDLGLSGANVAVASIAKGMVAMGWSVDWVVTGYTGSTDAEWLELDKSRLHAMPATAISDIKTRQRNLISFINERSPCVYIPNFDFDMACASPALREDVRVAFIVHSDDPVYYSFLDNHRHLCDAYIAVSEYLDREIKSRYRDLRASVVRIPFGVSVPSHNIPKPVRDRMQIVYAGRISQHQKRIFDLAEVINRAFENGDPFTFQIAGGGGDAEEFLKRIQKPLEYGYAVYHGMLSQSAILALLADSDVMVMTSEFEGLPIILLEAMAHGCVPVVTETKSGVKELVKHNETGLLSEIGDTSELLANLRSLFEKPYRDRMSKIAFEYLRTSQFSSIASLSGYGNLLSDLVTAQPRRVIGKSPHTPSNYRLGARVVAKLKSILGSRG